MVLEGPGGLAVDNVELGEFTIVFDDMSLKPKGKDRIKVSLTIDQN